MTPSDDRGRARRKRRVLDRVVALRRAGAGAPTPAEHETRPEPPADDIAALRERLDALEAAFEGLQDSVHREAERHQREIAELRRQVQPAEMARALSRDARERGL